VLSLALTASARKGSARDEGAAAFMRIKELYRRPVDGCFDTAQLLEVHRRIFQDLRHHGPGGYRPDAPGHYKVRGLDSSPMVYEVPYARGLEIATRLSETLQAGLLQELREADHETFVARMARLYGDLDYAHPFREGNSRTLREFTRELAQAAGKTMHWHHIAARMQGRALLYLARDAEIFRRHFPEIAAADYQPKGITIHEAKYLLTLEGKAYPTLAKAIQMTMEPPPESARGVPQRAEKSAHWPHTHQLLRFTLNYAKLLILNYFVFPSFTVAFVIFSITSCFGPGLIIPWLSVQVRQGPPVF